MAKAQRSRLRPATAAPTSTARTVETVVPPFGLSIAAAVPPAHRPWRIAAHVARCGVVVLAAGVLVGGDLGTSSEAVRRVSLSPSSASSVTPVLGGHSVRLVEARLEASSSRAESLALADAALEAAAAAGALSRAGVPEAPAEVHAGVATDGAVAGAADGATAVAEPVLTPEQAATLGALQVAAEVPDLPAPLEPVRSARDDRADDDEQDDGWADGGWADDGHLDAGHTHDEGLDAAGTGEAQDAHLAVGSLDDTSAGDLDAGVVVGAEQADPALGGDDLDVVADGQSSAEHTAALDAAVMRLSVLVAATGAGPLGAVDEIPVVPGTARVSSATPTDTTATDAVTDALTGEALTLAVRDAAGEVFALSLRVEEATQPAAGTEVLTREDALLNLGQAASALDSGATLLELEPLRDGERAALRPVVRAPSRAVAGTSATVADLATRWTNGQIPSAAMCPVAFDTRHLLQCDAAEALAALNGAYRAAFGTDIALTDSYRSLAGQVAVKKAKGFLAATPGTSNHGWGLAIDISGIGGLGQFDSPGYLWLKENAGAFGWHHPRGMEPGGSSPQEPWHWEFGTGAGR